MYTTDSAIVANAAGSRSNGARAVDLPLTGAPHWRPENIPGKLTPALGYGAVDHLGGR